MNTPQEIIDATFDEQLGRIRAHLEHERSKTCPSCGQRIPLPLAEIAEKTGLHENTIRNLMLGKIDRPSPETIGKLSAYLFA